MILLGQMGARLMTCVVVGLLAASAQAASDSGFVGSWEGESKCMVADSPCRDEHALYRIFADKQTHSQLKIDAFKIVGDAPDFMGTLICHHADGESNVKCTANTPRHDEWKFHIEGNTLSGTLTLDNGATLYRRILLHRSTSNAGPKR
jgi:hypothetical protein